MNKVPDAWTDEWSSASNNSRAPAEPIEPQKPTGKISKAQRRAQQAEFNRQLWAQAESPQEPNFFLESRNIVPLRSEFKPPPVLLSRKGPTTKTPKPPTDGLNGLTLLVAESSSEDEETAKQPTLAERQAQAAKDREEKQRKYESRRQELFGDAGATNAKGKNASGNSSPGNLTPVTSRPGTPSRGRGNGRGRGGRGGGGAHNRQQSQSRQGQGDLFDPGYAPKPDSIYLQRRENGTPKPTGSDVTPQRAPKGPDGSGRGGFGFVARGGRGSASTSTVQPTPQST